MTTLVCFLEEASAKAMLEGLLPRLFPVDVTVRYVVFEGKQDLEKQIAKRLRGWLEPNSVFMVMRDQDAGSCVRVKEKLISLCSSSGRHNVLVRVACHELESFYFGDLLAVERALDIKEIQRYALTRKFRVPDRIAKPSEELQRLTAGKYQKVSGSRAIGRELDLQKNSSHSFGVLLAGLRRLIAHAAQEAPAHP